MNEKIVAKAKFVNPDTGKIEVRDVVVKPEEPSIFKDVIDFLDSEQFDKVFQERMKREQEIRERLKKQRGRKE